MLTADHLRQAKEALRTSYLRYRPEAMAKVEAFLDRHIAELERQAVVFRRAGEGWAIGIGEPGIYTVAPEILPVAHEAIARGEVRVDDYDLARRQLRRAADWVEKRTRCIPLAQALREMRAAGGIVTYDLRRPGAPRFVT